jgi:hypothetical protein
MAQQETPDSVPQIIDAINRLIQTCVQNFGVRGTVLLLIGVTAAFVAFRLYSEWRKDKKTDTALKEKERSIQRLAEESRMWRFLFLKEKMGLTEEEAKRLVTRNEFLDAVSARRALEGEPSETARVSIQRRAEGD